MILADTSVWVEHFRHGLPLLAERLSQAQIAIHRVVIGELATGNLAQRKETLRWLDRLPRLEEPNPSECMAFLEQRKLSDWASAGMMSSCSRPPRIRECRSGLSTGSLVKQPAGFSWRRTAGQIAKRIRDSGPMPP
jgi:hypothetical protein